SLPTSHPVVPLLFSTLPTQRTSPLFPYTTLFRSIKGHSPTILLDDDQDIEAFEEKTLSFIVGNRLKNYPKNILNSEVKPKFKDRSEEHTSELQSREKLVCRLLRAKKKSRDVSTSR